MAADRLADMLPTATLHALRNGFRVVHVPLTSSGLTTIVVAVAAGTRCEGPAERGLAHVTEHVIFKGGKRYPTARVMNDAIAAIGGYNNAATNIEHTYYIIEVPNEHAAEALNIMADMMVHPRFPAEEFGRERKVVIDELIRAKQDDSRYIEILFEDLMYEHQPLGWDINGTRKNVSKLGRPAVLRFVKKWYAPSAMDCFLIGGGATPALAHQASAAFAALRSRPRPAWKPFARRKAGPRRRHLERDDELTSIMLGFPGVGLFSREAMAQRVLDVVLGGNTSSRLYNRLREERGLVYDIGAGSEFYSDAGHTATWTQAKARDAAKVERMVLEEYRRLLVEPPSAQEVAMAKEICLAGLAGLPEDHEALAVDLFKPLLLGGTLTQLSDLRRAMRAVRTDDVRRLIRRIIDPEAVVCTTIGRALT